MPPALSSPLNLLPATRDAACLRVNFLGLVQSFDLKSRHGQKNLAGESSFGILSGLQLRHGFQDDVLLKLAFVTDWCRYDCVLLRYLVGAGNSKLQAVPAAEPIWLKRSDAWQT